MGRRSIFPKQYDAAHFLTNYTHEIKQAPTKKMLKMEFFRNKSLVIPEYLPAHDYSDRAFAKKLYELVSQVVNQLRSRG